MVVCPICLPSFLIPLIFPFCSLPLSPSCNVLSMSRITLLCACLSLSWLSVTCLPVPSAQLFGFDLPPSVAQEFKKFQTPCYLKKKKKLQRKCISQKAFLLTSTTGTWAREKVRSPPAMRNWLVEEEKNHTFSWSCILDLHTGNILHSWAFEVRVI